MASNYGTFTVAADKSVPYAGRNFYGGATLRLLNTSENKAIVDGWVNSFLGTAVGFTFDGDTDATKVFNNTGNELAAGTLVYVNGWNAANKCPTIALADCDSPITSASFVVAATFPNNTVDNVYSNVAVSEINTSTSGNVGDPVYLSATAGGYAFDAPVGADQVVQIVGYVVVKAVKGTIAFNLKDVSKSGESSKQDASITLEKMPDNVFTKTKAAIEKFAKGMLTVDVVTADGNIGARRLVVVNSVTGEIEQATTDSSNVIGVNAENVDKVSTDDIVLGLGKQTCIADGPIEAGVPFKSAYEGRVIRLIDSELAGSTIVTGTGGNFSNQPTNDGVKVVSSSADDITQKVTIYGTTSGDATNAVVIEDVTLVGVTPVSTVKVDWGFILAIEVDGATVGDVTVTEANGGLTIASIAAGNLSAGVLYPTDTRAFNKVASVAASGECTKVVAVVGTIADHSTIITAKALSGTDNISLVDAMNTVDKFLVGDVANGTSVFVKVGTSDAQPELKKGITLTSAIAKDDEIEVILIP